MTGSGGRPLVSSLAMRSKSCSDLRGISERIVVYKEYRRIGMIPSGGLGFRVVVSQNKWTLI